MSIPKRTIQIWLGGDMPEEFINYRKKLMELHPLWTHELITEENIPDYWHVELSDYPTLANASNHFRLLALRLKGGVYLDSDVEVLRPLDDLLNNEAFFVRQSDGPICNAIIGSDPFNWTIEWMLGEHYQWKDKDASHGCHIISQAPLNYVTILEPETFFPWNWNEQPDMSKVTKETYGIHHWKGSWIK